jgi:hypothetical protein
MSLLRITLGLIVGIDIHIDNAESGAGVIRRRTPLTAQQFNFTQFFQRSASPVCLRPRRIETTLAFAAVLITEHPQLALAIASQPVWTEQTWKTVINGRNGPASLNCFVHSPIQSPQRPRSACSGNAHRSRLSPSRVKLNQISIL